MQVFHNLPFSCDEMWLFLAPCSASCSVSQHGSSPRDEESVAVVNAAQKAHGCWCCLFSKHCLIDWKLSLEEFQKIFLAWHMETGKTILCFQQQRCPGTAGGAGLLFRVLQGTCSMALTLGSLPTAPVGLELNLWVGGSCVYFSVLKSCWYGLSFVTWGLQQPKLADGDCSMLHGGGYLQWTAITTFVTAD